MAGVLGFAASLNQAGQICQAVIAEVTAAGSVRVQMAGTTQVLDCQILHSGTLGLILEEGDTVLVWRQDAEAGTGVVLGRIGPYTAAKPVVSVAEFAARPQTLVLEAQGDIVLRNGQAKLTLGADGDVEIVCASYTTRSHRLLRLLAPLIKLN
jgi:hypothetical protein